METYIVDPLLSVNERPNKINLPAHGPPACKQLVHGPTLSSLSRRVKGRNMIRIVLPNGEVLLDPP
jgi:hypothetical protein